MFEWDDEKNATNIRKHGVDFADARRIFEGRVWTVVDDRFEYGEVREVSTGIVDGRAYLTVVHTRRGDVTRIISARISNRRERQRYGEEIR